MRYASAAVLLSAALALSACAEKRGTPQASPAPQPGQRMEARARLSPTAGNQAEGTVVFVEQAEGVRVIADLKGLSPGKHGFHVHEKGDCSAPDASSAGGHFAPGGSPHGSPDNPPSARHAGDLGNIEAGADGRARYERLDTVLQLRGTESIIGKAVVVHAGPDDLTSQPAGNSGPRVACGVIALP